MLYYPLLYELVVLGVGYLCIWVVCRVFLKDWSGIPELGTILIAFVVSPFSNIIKFLVASLPFILGFFYGRSTKIPADFIQQYSIRAGFVKHYSLTKRVSDKEYARIVDIFHLEMAYSNVSDFFISSNIRQTDKFSLLFQILYFSLYRHARGAALFMSWCYLVFWNLSSELETPLSFLLILFSIPLGYSIGVLWKYIRGNTWFPNP